MDRWPWTALVLTLGLMLATLSPAAARQLRVLTWSSYLSPEVVERFEKETGIAVTVDTVTSYTDLMRPLLSGRSGYDVAFPADFQVQELVARGLLEKIGADRLPNFWNVEDAWRSRALDPRNEYTVPHAWGTTAFVVDTAAYAGDIDTLDLLFAPPPELDGRIALLDGGFDMVQLALVWLRLPRCSLDPDHLARVEALLLPMLRQYPLNDIDNVLGRLADPAVVVGVAWNGDALRARQKRPSLRYARPREGSLVWTDVLVVPKDAPNKVDALRFLSFMMRPEIAALQSGYNGYANMIRGSERHLGATLVTAPEIVAPVTSRPDFFTYCQNAAEARQELLWRAIKHKAGR